jgi:glutamate 5-kinase
MAKQLIDKRIVVKVGTTTLTHENGELNYMSFEKLARIISDVANRGYEVILVSSGAIAVGRSKLRLSAAPEELRLKQAAAAIGQCELMHLYDKFFAEYGRTVGQILLVSEDVERPEIRRNLVNTFDSLLELGVVPIVNENDSVSYAEIETGNCGDKLFGDNDTLSAVVAQLCGASLLVLFSDIDGLYDSDPRENGDASLYREVHEISEEIFASAGASGSGRGKGGMVTKLQAARRNLALGIDTVITNGQRLEDLYGILDGKPVGTLFTAKS